MLIIFLLSISFEFLKAMKYQQQFKQVQCKLFIDGNYVDSVGGKKFDVINPATEEVIGQSVGATSTDVDLAVKSAHKAFHSGPWRKMNDSDRAKILFKFANLLDQNT